MRVVVVGGNLQGLEATYLAHRAGWEVEVIDKDFRAPAGYLAQKFTRIDIRRDHTALVGAIKGAGFVIPALEDREVLGLVQKAAQKVGVPLAYDPHAYRVSASKITSNELLGRIGIPTPLPWGRCSLPLIAKPARGSGSRGVRKLSDLGSLERFVKEVDKRQEEWVLEEFVDGRGFSLEVIGWGDEFRTLQVTEVQVDEVFDAKRIIAPVDLPPGTQGSLRTYVETIAAAVKLRGIMDVEAVLGADGWKVLEIDARLPSQTPTTVYHSTGWNMLEMLYRVFVQGSLPEMALPVAEKAVIYQQVQASNGSLRVVGERVISKVGCLRLQEDFYGADEALTNYQPGSSEWVAALILTGANREEVIEKSNWVLRNIATSNDLSLVDGL